MASQERWSLQCFMGLPRGLHVVAMVSTPPHGDVREASRPDSTSNGSFRYGGAPSLHGLARGARASDHSGGETYCFLGHPSLSHDPELMIILKQRSNCNLRASLFESALSITSDAAPTPVNLTL